MTDETPAPEETTSDPQLPGLLDGTEVESIDIVEDLETSYLTYAMSVIVSRALPDVRDGLKPVHRRILYAMHENGLTAGAKYRKSASVVGSVLAKYHPHGDSAVYQSMVRMAQDFAMRYPLVDGQGNFGSIDGDNAAAMRYTEARLTRLSEVMLVAIEKDTVDFRPNYDSTTEEPTVLPATIPQLLLNGSMGIAVGMATNIPPHNLGEVVSATRHLIDHPEATVEDLLQFLKGPDFPTGGEIYDGGAVREMYSTGRGSVVMRAKTHIEESKQGRVAIVVTEIPYQVNKAELVIHIANLVRDKKITGITDLRDESNREGIRLVIELKKDAFPRKILNQLFRDTALQKSFNLNLIALVDGIHPRLLNLREVLQHFIDHRLTVTQRRVQYEKRLAEARAHILEGLSKALNHIDQVIETIKKSETKEIAAQQLQKQFELTEPQTKAILEMRLQTLAGLERQKIEDELAEKLAFIKDCEAILSDPVRQRSIISDEMEQVVSKYGDERRTTVHPHALGKFSARDTIPDEEMVVILTSENYIKRLSPTLFRSQKRGGVGVIGASTKDDDIIHRTVFGSNHNTLLFFTSKGRVFSLPTYEIPESSRTAKGTPVVNLLQLQPDEKVTEILNLSRSVGAYIVMATTGGTIKKTAIDQFQNIRRSGLIVCNLKEGELLRWAKLSSAGDDVFMVTQGGKTIRFSEADVRPMGRAATGVRGVRLKDSDQVVEVDILRPEEEARLLVVTEQGRGKMTLVDQYGRQKRGGQGVKVSKLTARTGLVAGARVIRQMVGDVLIFTKNGQTLRTPLVDVKTSGKDTQGVILMRSKDDQVSSITLIQNLDATEETAKDPVAPAEQSS